MRLLYQALGVLVALGLTKAFTVPSRRPTPLRRQVRLFASEGTEKKVQSKLLDPFPAAADPMWSVRGPVGEGDFIVSREGGPTAEELTNENILRIVMIESSDLEVRAQTALATLLWL
mmetsp:Transcript_19845/g.29373  ORF Transcript_19845/g.29373 Transcript_19845/m.29373 type:complete len:117 (-) Transcript_19845:623-973(-)